MAKLTEAQKRKNFERTVGSSENDMGPVNTDSRYKNYLRDTTAIDESVKQKALKVNPGKEKEITEFLKNKRTNQLKDIKSNPTQFFNERDERLRAPTKEELDNVDIGMKKGGAVKKMAKGGSVSSASKRADGIAVKGKTRGKIC